DRGNDLERFPFGLEIDKLNVGLLRTVQSLGSAGQPRVRVGFTLHVGEGESISLYIVFWARAGRIDDHGLLELMTKGFAMHVFKIGTPEYLLADGDAVGVDGVVFIAPVGPACVWIWIGANIVFH